MMPKLATLVAFLLLLSACQQALVRDEDSFRSRVSVGSSFTLHQTLKVPEGHARVFLQGGEVVAKARLEQYQPHCNFEVRAVSTGDHRIEPDTFVVTRVTEDEEQVVDRMRPQRYASLLASADGMEFVTITRYVQHALHSERQPQVMRLTCHGGRDEPWQVKTPSISEIRQVLGEFVTLTLHN